MDALRSIQNNVPDWNKRLEELNIQIDQRQVELARVSEQQDATEPGLGRAKSVRNKGSTESLKPQDDAEAHPGMDSLPLVLTPDEPPSSPVGAPAVLQRQSRQVMAVAQANARAVVKKIRTESVMTGEADGAQKYRTRSMIIVYYDSFVQSFFEELVKFVSASRNMMRKAKMAAKVAQIKRMAEIDMPSAGSGSGDVLAADDNLEASAPLEASPLADGTAPTPTLTFTRTSQMRGSRGLGAIPMGRAYVRAGTRLTADRAGVAAADGGDVYDELDKHLEHVQALCEHGAHQFLRDGDCHEEIETIKKRLADAKACADKEMERIKKEDPDVLLTPEEPAPRSFRPQSVRRDYSASSLGKPRSRPDAASPSPSPAPSPMPVEVAPSLEVDEGVGDMEDDYEPPKLVFKSTRRMR